jgi:hypothetical protein
MNVNYNTNYKFKINGYMYNYNYTYKHYLLNKNIGNDEILKNKDLTVFVYIQKQLNLKIFNIGIINYNIFNNYSLFIIFINNKILEFIKLKNIIEKNIKEISLAVWEFNFLFHKKLKIKEEKEYNKKLKIFYNKLNEIIIFKFDLENFSNYKLQLLLKDLKKTLFVKIPNIEENLEKCVKHLYNLIKKWKGNNKKELYKWIIKTINKYKN